MSHRASTSRLQGHEGVAMSDRCAPLCGGVTVLASQRRMFRRRRSGAVEAEFAETFSLSDAGAREGDRYEARGAQDDSCRRRLSADQTSLNSLAYLWIDTGRRPQCTGVQANAVSEALGDEGIA